MSWLSENIDKATNAVSHDPFGSLMDVYTLGASSWLEDQTGINQESQAMLAALIGGGLMMMPGAASGTVGAVPATTVVPNTYYGYGAPAASSSGAFWKGAAGSLFGNALGGWGSTVLGVAGDVYAANKLAEGQSAANAMNLSIAREQMGFQERMSNTAHQREVKDLIAAGLNPVLSANAGASTPVGNMAVMENAAPNYSGLVSSAIQARRIAQDIRESESRIAMNINSLNVQNAQANAATASAKEALSRAEVNLQEGYIKRIKNDLYRRRGKWLIPLEKTVEVGGNVAAGVRDLGIGLGQLSDGFMPIKIKGFGGRD